MKQMSIQTLKAQLSAAVAEAQSGRTIVVTRHNEPVAHLSPAQAAHVHPGRRPGAWRLKPAVRQGTKGRYLQVLSDDRSER